MFYGLNNFFKKILPKRLFYRSLFIVATPIILLQVIITIVFFDSLWIKANKGMTRSLVGEVETLFDVYRTQKDEKQKETLIAIYNKNFDLTVALKENEILPKDKTAESLSPLNKLNEKPFARNLLIERKASFLTWSSIKKKPNNLFFSATATID